MTLPAQSPPIRLRGVRHNNLKNFALDLPSGRLIVITGLSGSGKSSLAFDTLYAEGQRRYIETFSPYARQFFDRMDKPQVDRIDGIPPAIAIEQRNTVRTTRSTVGTMTELCDYLKLLWPHLAQLHCRQCAQPVRKEPPHAVWQRLNDEGRMTKDDCLVTFDLPLSEKLPLADSLALIAKQGYQRLLVNDAIVRVDEAAADPAFVRHHSSLTVIQDRLRVAPGNRARFVEACEQAYHFGKGKLAIRFLSPPPAARPALQHSPTPALPHSIAPILHFSQSLHCAACNLDYREPTPALFSFNHPVGACPQCKGFGRIISIDYDLALPDRSLTLAEGAIKPWRSGFSAECQGDLLKFCRARRIPSNVPFADLPRDVQNWVIQGDPDYGTDDAHQWPHAWYGIKGYFRWLEGKAYKMHVRVLLSRYRAYTKCPACDGQRLQPDALLYLLSLEARAKNPRPLSSSALVLDNRKNSRTRTTDEDEDEKGITTSAPSPGNPPPLSLADFYALPIDTALRVIEHLAASRRFSARDPLGLTLEEVRSRLQYLVEVGLGYLTLDRSTRTLSGGETERVSLTTCLGTRLVNTLFVLDEPSVGLHARDTARLVNILEKLRDTGNTVVVVEHEPNVIRAADQVVDLGPGSGEAGGQVVFQGPLNGLLRSRESLTGQYLSGRRQIEIPPRRSVQVGQASRLSRAEQSASSAPESNTTNAAPSSIQNRRDACPKLTVTGANRHNLKNISVTIPLQRFVCLTGVSGSGKTTLVREVLLPALSERLQSTQPGRKASDRLTDEDSEADETQSAIRNPQSAIAGWEHLDRVVLVDQSPLGKSPRSNPAVYTGAFDHIRELFAQTDLARQRGLNASAFSFNSAQGQCERCRGAGFEKVEMQFLSDVFIRCPDCQGRRYRAHILEVKVDGGSELMVEGRKPARGRRDSPSTMNSDSPSTKSLSIADLLESTVNETVAFLASLPASRPAGRAMGALRLLQEVGLGYLRLGQPINTLSGGESQRLKLVSHLAEAGAGDARPSESAAPGVNLPRSDERSHTLFLFDEPTTGLHYDDVRVLLLVFQRLVDAGHSLLVIEHNLDVIKCADWVVDLGPEAGERGGHLVAEGPPETIAACEASHTGRALVALLEPFSPRPNRTAKRVP